MDKLDETLRRLGAHEADLPQWRTRIELALKRAALDHAAHTGLRTTSPSVRLIQKAQRLARKAKSGDVRARSQLVELIGDGVELDAAIDALMGAPEDQTHTARTFATRPHDDLALGALGGLLDAADRYGAPRTRRRRGAKFFAVLALGFVFVALTGRRPTVVIGDRSHDGDAEGPFWDFVIAVARTKTSPDLRGLLEKAVIDVSAIGRWEFDIAIGHRAAGLDLDPPPFGTPDFNVIEISRENDKDEADVFERAQTPADE